MSDHNIRIGAGALVIKDGKTLLTKRKSHIGIGTYGSVGGHVEFGESIIDAVKREAKEELDIEIGNLRFAVCINWVEGDKHYVDVSFTADLISGEPKVMEPDKIESVGWYPMDNLPQPLFEPVKYVLEALKTGNVYYEINDKD